MDEHDLQASNRRMWIMVGAGAGVLALVVALFFFIGKQLGAPIESYDREGVARAMGEGVRQVGQTAQAAAGGLSPDAAAAKAATNPPE